MRITTAVGLRASVFVCLLGVHAEAISQYNPCGSLKNHYGPYDYRTSGPVQRELVESNHFTHKVESLRGGNTSITAGGDLTYTLQVYPNHHRALMAMMKLTVRERTDRPRDSAWSMACWFDRAERFRPDDQLVKVLHGIYLTRKGEKGDAVKKLDEAMAQGVPSPNTDYNMGLAYADLGQYEKALVSAHRAYAAGFPLAGLRNKLKRAGKWREAPPQADQAETKEASPGSENSPDLKREAKD